jgi:hypothetical protein
MVRFTSRSRSSARSVWVNIFDTRLLEIDPLATEFATTAEGEPIPGVKSG